MSNNQRKAQRKLEIAEAQEEGRQAALAGRHVQTNPYRDMDRTHWVVGYEIGQRELYNASNIEENDYDNEE